MEESDYLSLLPHKGVARWSTVNLFPHWCNGNYGEVCSGTIGPSIGAWWRRRGKRHIDVVLVWRYDRFARSTQALVQALQEFQHLGVDFISYQENIDTTTPQGEMIFTVMASLAQFESALISARVKAGMARARAQGQRISRAPLSSGSPATHCRTLSAGALDSPDWPAAGDWVRDRVELRPARQDRAPRRAAGGYTVNFPAITPGAPILYVF